jgi:hypothetical protein
MTMTMTMTEHMLSTSTIFASFPLRRSSPGSFKNGIDKDDEEDEDDADMEMTT